MQPLPGGVRARCAPISGKSYNNELRIITELPRATQIETLHEQTGMETMKKHVRRLTTKLCCKSQLSDNSQLSILGKHKRTRALIGRVAKRLNFCFEGMFLIFRRSVIKGYSRAVVLNCGH
jgi:hypothetical protein